MEEGGVQYFVQQEAGYLGLWQTSDKIGIEKNIFAVGSCRWQNFRTVEIGK
jgi:hypothetical protein